MRVLSPAGARSRSRRCAFSVRQVRVLGPSAARSRIQSHGPSPGSARSRPPQPTVLLPNLSPVPLLPLRCRRGADLHRSGQRSQPPRRRAACSRLKAAASASPCSAWDTLRCDATWSGELGHSADDYVRGPGQVVMCLEGRGVGNETRTSG